MPFYFVGAHEYIAVVWAHNRAQVEAWAEKELEFFRVNVAEREWVRRFIRNRKEPKKFTIFSETLG
jgi:hypothetical protein|tara:strand:- start:564 stop:761 length:198 start_codon:yes stop_codon:yes gene_type:complete